MRKQNASGKLFFNKAIVTELDNQTLAAINGGTSYLTVVGPISAFTILTVDTSVIVD